MQLLVVGCGLCGSVIARYAAEKLGWNVTVWERREHIGGNLYDYTDDVGINVHKYGPHTFHTSKRELYDYICRFEEWVPFKLTCGTYMLGKYTPVPFNFQTVDDFFTPEKAKLIKRELQQLYGSKAQEYIISLLKSDNPIIAEYARFLFKHDYRPYTAKQWGMPPEEIDESILRRVPVVFSYDTGYFTDTYQVMPKNSYKAFFDRIISHPCIRVEKGIDASVRLSIKDNRLYIDGRVTNSPVVYTGAIDELLGCNLGRLPYRSLHFEWETKSVDSFQPFPVVAYPEAEGYTRITEYKKLPEQFAPGVTTVAVEYPLEYTQGENEPYYPVLTEDSVRLYNRYKEALDTVPGLYFCGRLADFRYYNMDQALERALGVCSKMEALST